jgi:hypothetical protein
MINFSTDGGEWLASRPDRFITGELLHDNNWIGGYVGHVDAMDKRKMSRACRESNTNS